MGLPIDGVADLYGDLSPAEREYVRSTLSPLVPTDIVDQAAGAIDKLGPAAAQAVSALGSGNTVTAVEGAIPLIAGGMATFGGPVGLAAAGVISAGGTVFGLLADALHLGAQRQDVCSWVVGGVCFNKGRPYGPGATSPPWVRIDDFAKMTLAYKGDWHSHNDVPVVGNYASWLNVAFDDIGIDDIGWELWALGDHVSPAAVAWRENKRLGGWSVDDSTGQTDNGAGFKQDAPSRPLAGTPQGAFLMAFYRALVHSLEFPINGYQQPDPYGLLLATKGAFDSQRSASKTWTFQPSTTGTWLERFLGAAVFDNKGYPPQTINVGPKSIALRGLVGRGPLPDLSALRSPAARSAAARGAARAAARASAEAIARARRAHGPVDRPSKPTSRVAKTAVAVGAVSAVGVAAVFAAKHLAGAAATTKVVGLFRRKKKP